MTALYSAWLLVVLPIAWEMEATSLPCSSFMVAPIAAGPGLPSEAPSVYITTLSTFVCFSGLFISLAPFLTALSLEQDATATATLYQVTASCLLQVSDR